MAAIALVGDAFCTQQVANSGLEFCDCTKRINAYASRRARVCVYQAVFYARISVFVVSASQRKLRRASSGGAGRIAEASYRMALYVVHCARACIARLCSCPQ